MNNHGAITVVARQCRSAPLNDGTASHMEVDLYGVDLHILARRLTENQKKWLLDAPAMQGVIREVVAKAMLPNAATGTPPVDLTPLTEGKP